MHQTESDLSPKKWNSNGNESEIVLPSKKIMGNWMRLISFTLGGPNSFKKEEKKWNYGYVSLFIAKLVFIKNSFPEKFWTHQ